MILDVGGVELLGVREPVGVPLREATWSNEASTPSLVRVAECAIPSGSYRALRLHLLSVTAPAGVAMVHPSPPDSVVLAADIEILPGRTSLWIVDWLPQALGDPNRPYETGLSLVEPTLPPPGGAILVTNEESNSLTLLDRWRLTPRGEISVGRGPRGMAWSRLHQRLYVALAGDDAVAVIDLVDHRKEQEVGLHAGDTPSRLWMDEANSRLFVLNSASSTVSILDAGFLQELERLVVEPEPVAFAYDPLRKRLYVSSRVRDAVIVYDMDDQREPLRWNVDGGAGELILDETRSLLLVASARQRKIVMLDAQSGAVVALMELCSAARGLAFAPLGREVVAAASRCRKISFAAVTQGMETTQVRLPFAPGLLITDSASSQIYAVMPDGDGLAVVGAQSRELTGWIPVGRRPYAVLVP